MDALEELERRYGREVAFFVVYIKEAHPEDGWVLDRNRSATLFVNDFNAPALALYRRMGFVATADWASAFYDSGR